MTKKAPLLDLTSFAREGAGFREEQLPPAPAPRPSQSHQVTLEEAIAEAKARTRKGGRKPAFEGDLIKVALFLPPDVAAELKAAAAKRHFTPSQLVALWVASR